ncbi:phosphatidylinositol phosphate synthase [Trueperella sp. LYQ143]|uniref:phosphatidylinositol phosphate synthase n=1 Tax=unclassified Trueperella TaxID=2630174 RepID=UPI003983B0FA
MLSRSGRPLAQILFGPFARFFVRMGVSANVMTVVGGLASAIAALVCFPLGWLIPGAIITTILVIFDNLDGQMARMTNTSSKWGAFLDSTMDRISDGAIFAALAMWGYFHADHTVRAAVISGALLSLVAGSVVPYARARAEGVGYSASVGLAERADRLIAALVIVVLVGVGLPHIVMAVGLWLLGVFALITVIQRMAYVYRQMKEAGDA